MHSGHKKSDSDLWRKKWWEKFSLIRLNLIWEFVQILEGRNFPLDNFVYSGAMSSSVSGVNNQIFLESLLSQIFLHYGLRCKFTIEIVSDLGTISNGSKVAANIEVPTKIPKPDSKEFVGFVFVIRIDNSQVGLAINTLCNILGHEVAHAYLHSHDVKNKQSELMTDLCAIYAGFAPMYALHNVVKEKDFSGAAKAFVKDQSDNIFRGGGDYISRWEFWVVEKLLVISNLKKKWKQISKTFN